MYWLAIDRYYWLCECARILLHLHIRFLYFDLGHFGDDMGAKRMST